MFTDMFTKIGKFFTQVLERADSLLPHPRAETPKRITHYHDDDDSEEESDKSS